MEKELKPYCGKCDKEMEDHGTYLRCESGECKYAGSIVNTVVALIRNQRAGLLVFK